MNSLSTRIFAALFVLLFGVATVAYWLYPGEPPKKPDIASISRFDFIFHKDIDLAVRLARVPDLREFGLRGDDIEVRIWRMYSLPALEGVFLRRISGEWSGSHLRIRTDEQGYIQAAEVEVLKTPEVGWESFWGKIVDKGILLFPLTPENDCERKYIDGIVYIVEINQNGTYRNFQYMEGGSECRREAEQMTEIGEIIGLEFNSGQEECKQYDWFACMTERKGKNLPN